MRVLYSFLVPILLWRKKNALFCTNQWDCPRCDIVFSNVGFCRDFPLKPVFVPVPLAEPVAGPREEGGVA